MVKFHHYKHYALSARFELEACHYQRREVDNAAASAEKAMRFTPLR